MRTTGLALWEVTGDTIVPPVRVAAQSETAAVEWARHVYSRKYTQARFVEGLDDQPDFVEGLDDQPDFVGCFAVAGASPNYDKFKGWPPERVLSWLNID